MPYLEPAIEFWKGAIGLAWGNSVASIPNLAGPSYDNCRISYGDGSAFPTPGGQSGNWMNKITHPGASQDSCDGETNLWATLPATLSAAGIESGMGFINDLSTEKDILQGNLSAVMNVIIFNNRDLVAGGNPVVGPGQSFTSAENCKLRMFDSPGSPNQTAPPIANFTPGVEHAFWPLVRQLSYWTYEIPGAGSWTQAGAKTFPGPYGLGKGDELAGSGTNPPIPAVSGDVWDTVPGGAPDGVGTFYVGSETNSFIGCTNASLAPDAENYGAACELQVMLAVPDAAPATLHWWALAIEYTFTV